MANPHRDPGTGRFTSKSGEVAKALGKSELRNELGVSTRRHVGRSLYDDFLPQLRGTRAAKVYTEMANNDATIGNIQFAIDMLLRELDWFAKGEDEEWAEFVNDCFDDMTHPFSDHISAALSMLPHGYSAHEIVYRMRKHSEGSRYDDGKWGWRKFAFRPQDSIDEFLLDETGGYSGLRQGDIALPIEKLIIYRTSAQHGPAGRSAFRNAYVSWFYKKRADELMMIGAERDLAGMPVARIPADSIISQDATYDYVVDLVTRTKRDEQEGLVMPSDRDENSNLLYDIELLSPGGGAERLQGILNISRALATDIAGTVAADFISLGRDAVGSRALADPKITLFLKALEAWADVIADTLTRHVVPRLMELNGVAPDSWPTITHSPVEEVDLAAIGEFIDRTAKAGYPWFGVPEDPIEDEVRQMAGFEPMPPELVTVAEEMRMEERAQREAMAQGFQQMRSESANGAGDNSPGG